MRSLQAYYANGELWLRHAFYLLTDLWFGFSKSALLSLQQKAHKKTSN
jgi:hypothetical protein